MMNEADLKYIGRSVTGDITKIFCLVLILTNNHMVDFQQNQNRLITIIIIIIIII